MNKETEKIWVWKGLGFGLASFGLLAGVGSCCKAVQEGGAVYTVAKAESRVLTDPKLKTAFMLAEKQTDE